MKRILLFQLKVHMHRLHQKMKFKSRFAHDDNDIYPMLIMS